MAQGNHPSLWAQASRPSLGHTRPLGLSPWPLTLNQRKQELDVVVLTPPREVPAPKPARRLWLQSFLKLTGLSLQSVSLLYSFQQVPLCLCETKLLSAASKQGTLNQ